jgi:hypothetical protein
MVFLYEGQTVKMKDIERMIAACGCTSRIKEVAVLRQSGLGYDVHYHVLAYKKGYRGRSLGKLSVVEKLNEEELRNRVEAKFANAPIIFGAFFNKEGSDGTDDHETISGTSGGGR